MTQLCRLEVKVTNKGHGVLVIFLLTVFWTPKGCTLFFTRGWESGTHAGSVSGNTMSKV